MSFEYHARTDLGRIVSHRALEVPVSGPGDINTWATLTGVAIMDRGQRDDDGDDDLSSEGVITRGDIYITDTEYTLGPGDQLRGVSAWVALASIQRDDDPDVTALVLEAVEARPVGNLIEIHVHAAAEGDVSLLRVSYELNVLLHRA